MIDYCFIKVTVIDYCFIKVTVIDYCFTSTYAEIYT